jgi:peptidyl-prolyl cis-trans isomerase SurA
MRRKQMASLKFIWIISFYLVFSTLVAQPVLADEVVAVVGSEAILRSDVEARFAQQRNNAREGMPQLSRCELFEDFIFNKMLLFQAELDSIEVSQDAVDAEVERRIGIFIAQAGGKAKAEQRLGISLDKLRTDLEPTIREQMLISQVENKLFGEVKVTPAEVRKVFETWHPDSLPFIPAEFKLAHLVIKPGIRPEEKEKVTRELKKMREDLLAGGNFCLKAKFNSDDLGSAQQCGELGFLRREDLVPEFAAVGFSLKPGEISDVVETQFGFHIIQLIEKRGEYANFRHILIRPKVSTSDLVRAEYRLDSIAGLYRSGTFTFADLTRKYSEDEETRMNGGQLFNPYSNAPLFTMEELDPETAGLVKELKVNEISPVQILQGQAGLPTVRIILMVEKRDPHKANLTMDYGRIQEFAVMRKKLELTQQWVQRKKRSMYISVNGFLDICPDAAKWNNQ